MNPRLRAIAQTTAIVAAGSFTGVLTKLVLRDVPAFTFLWLQFAIGGVLLTLYTFAWRRERIPRGLGREVWAYIAWIGLANFAVVRLCFMLALERMPATTNAYLVNFVGIVTMLMSIAFLREWPSAIQVAGAVIAIAGLKVFFREIPPPQELLGVLYVAIGILGLASTNNVARKLAQVTGNGLSNNIVSTVALWIGGIPVILAGLATNTPPPVTGLRGWAIIALSALVSITIGLTVWNSILRTLRSYEASILAATTVIWTALFALPILGEHLQPHQVGGILLMLAGVVLAQVRRGWRSGGGGGPIVKGRQPPGGGD